MKFLQGNQDMHTWMDPRGGHTDLVEVALVLSCIFAFNDPILENLKDSLTFPLMFLTHHRALTLIQSIQDVLLN